MMMGKFSRLYEAEPSHDKQALFGEDYPSPEQTAGNQLDEYPDHYPSPEQTAGNQLDEYPDQLVPPPSWLDADAHYPTPSPPAAAWLQTCCEGIMHKLPMKKSSPAARSVGKDREFKLIGGVLQCVTHLTLAGLMMLGGAHVLSRVSGAASLEIRTRTHMWCARPFQKDMRFCA
jgi:hypothetical protein